MSPRFNALGLRFNPFGSLTPGELGAHTVPSLPPPVRGECVQLVADHGRGKTTCLRQWEAAVPGALFVRGGRDAWPDLSACEFLLLDEAETVSRAQLAQAAKVPTLAVSAHRDLSRALGRPVRTLVLPAADLDWLEAAVARRVAFARLGEQPVPEVPREVFAQLLARHRDDLRAITDALYEWYPGFW
ncbi:MAG: hypothetical protein RL653_2387 [Pseudomonadota bacterium]